MMLHDCFPYVKNPMWRFPEYYAQSKREIVNSMKIIPHATLEGWMLGNPRILTDCDYEQDALMSLRKHFKHATEEEGKTIINAFVHFNKTLIAHSLVDRNFNITDNFAMNTEGKIVLMDLGELYSDPEQIRLYLVLRPWAVWDITHTLPEDLREYFVRAMDAAFAPTSTDIGHAQS